MHETRLPPCQALDVPPDMGPLGFRGRLMSFDVFDSDIQESDENARMPR
jgi:hypothetical protein